MRGAVEARAGMRGVGEVGAEVTVVTSRGRLENGHNAAPVKSGTEITPAAMAQLYTEEKKCTGRTQEISILK